MSDPIVQTFDPRDDYSLVSNAMTFLRVPKTFNPYSGEYDAVITGVPFDMATTGRAGTRFGPEALRSASVNLAWEECRYPWSFSLRKNMKLADCGDLIYEFGNYEDFKARLEAHAYNLVKAKILPVFLGGDHSITLPILRGACRGSAQAGGRQQPIALLHFDAHSDTYDKGPECDHGTMFYRLLEEGVIDAEHSVQIGIRTEYSHDLPYTVIDGNLCDDLSAEKILAIIDEKIKGRLVYVSFDIDCLDPAFAPGTGTPVCGGLSSLKALRIIRGLAQCSCRFLGMDLVEVSPPYDHAQITALAGANIITDFLHAACASSKLCRA